MSVLTTNTAVARPAPLVGDVELAELSGMDHSQTAVGTIAGRAKAFLAPHRDSNDTPITAVVTLTVPMSHEDVEAVLWWMLRDEGVTFDDLADDADALTYLLESMIGHGTWAVESYRLDLADLRPSDPNYHHLVRLRRRVEDLIGPRLAPVGLGARQV